MSLLMDALKKAEQAKAEQDRIVDITDEQTYRDIKEEAGLDDMPDHAHKIRSVADSNLVVEYKQVSKQPQGSEEELDFSIEQLDAGMVASEDAAHKATDVTEPDPVADVPVTLAPVPTPTPVSNPAPQPEPVSEADFMHAELAAVTAPTADRFLTEKRAVRMQTPVGIGKPGVNRTYLWSGLGLFLFCAGLAYYYFTVSYVERVTADYQGNTVVSDTSVTESKSGIAQHKIEMQQPVRDIPPPVTKVAAAQPQSPVVKQAGVQKKVTTPEPSVADKPAAPKKVRTTSAPVVQIEKTVAVDPIQRMLQKAFAYYQGGDHDQAVTLYRQVIQREADNRDALLGMAIIAQRKEQYNSARMLYQRLLTLNPKDSVAASGLMSLNQGNTTTLNISQIKLMLQQEPAAAHLYFALANEYAAQSRWPEAQQAYFQAYHYAPENADYVFNLAVSLEKIGQPENALLYYRQALSINNDEAVLFDRQRVAQRIDTLMKISSGK